MCIRDSSNGGVVLFPSDTVYGLACDPSDRGAIERLYALTRGRDVYITTEVGQHQMWAAQFFHFEEPNRWMTSGGLGTMGYGLPAAMGVQIAHPDALVIDIAGEASILMNIQEMSTLCQYRLPVKIFILNNRYMGCLLYTSVARRPVPPNASASFTKSGRAAV